MSKRLCRDGVGLKVSKFRGFLFAAAAIHRPCRTPDDSSSSKLYNVRGIPPRPLPPSRPTTLSASPVRLTRAAGLINQNNGVVFSGVSVARGAGETVRTAGRGDVVATIFLSLRSPVESYTIRINNNNNNNNQPRADDRCGGRRDRSAWGTRGHDCSDTGTRWGR